MTVQNTLLTKVPPQNIEAEMAVLGSMLLSNEAIIRSIEFLSEDSFYKTLHGHIYRNVVELFDAGEPVDIVTLTERLKKKGQLEAIGGASYLTNIMETVPTAVNVDTYIKIVREKKILRSLIHITNSISQHAYDQVDDMDSFLDISEQQMFDVCQDRISHDVVSLKDIVKSSFETIERLYTGQETITGIPSGFHDLDMMTSGFQPSELIVIAGRPSMGKSALATCIAEHVGVEKGIPLAIFSLEMSKESLVQRMLCSQAKVNFHSLRNGFLGEEDWVKLTNTAGKLSESPIYIDDTPSLSAFELRAKARRLKQRYDIKLIIVDYLQLMHTAGRAENRQQEISQISMGLKSLARELDVAVLALSQLSRAVESRTDHRPMLSDLRESGSIEQDADVVLMLVREEYYNPTEENRGIAEIIVGKQRNGPTGAFKLAFLHKYTRFESLSNRESSQPK